MTFNKRSLTAPMTFCHREQNLVPLPHHQTRSPLAYCPSATQEKTLLAIWRLFHKISRSLRAMLLLTTLNLKKYFWNSKLSNRQRNLKPLSNKCLRSHKGLMPSDKFLRLRSWQLMALPPLLLKALAATRFRILRFPSLPKLRRRQLPSKPSICCVSSSMMKWVENLIIWARAISSKISRLMREPSGTHLLLLSISITLKEDLVVLTVKSCFRDKSLENLT